jgi:alkylation response protein AidB-like acyl-CoA dehydrogenase
MASNANRPGNLDGDSLITALRRERSAIQQSTRRPEASDRFPVDALNILRELGALAAPLPMREGGLGWGTEQVGIAALCTVLQILGYGSLPLGRVYEAHVNAIALIFRYGGAAVRATAAVAAHDGELFGLWVTPGQEPVRALRRDSHFTLVGRKAFCSAAGFAKWALITALDERDHEQMFIVSTAQLEVSGEGGALPQGMRGTSTRPVVFDCQVPAEHQVGSEGEYLREPDFSGGAWRTSAVTVGGLLALVDEAVRQLRTRGRHTDPHQAARIGQMLMRCHTATAWIDAVAARSVRHRAEPENLIGYINLARLAIEQACLEVIPIVQRSLGLNSFLVSNPLSAMMADLATYLRQPAGDEILTQAAIHFAESSTPTLLGLTD